MMQPNTLSLSTFCRINRFKLLVLFQDWEMYKAEINLITCVFIDNKASIIWLSHWDTAPDMLSE